MERLQRCIVRDVTLAAVRPRGKAVRDEAQAAVHAGTGPR